MSAPPYDSRYRLRHVLLARQLLPQSAAAPDDRVLGTLGDHGAGGGSRTWTGSLRRRGRRADGGTVRGGERRYARAPAGQVGGLGHGPPVRQQWQTRAARLSRPRVASAG